MEDLALMGENRDHVCKQDDDSQGGDITRSMDDLLEDICGHIHALMPLRDAARARASPTFLRSWRCRPNQKDICGHIHALMPLRDAARAACASPTFLRSWICRPNLTLSEETLGLNGDVIGKDEMTRDLVSNVDQILKNHSGVGTKA